MRGLVASLVVLVWSNGIARTVRDLNIISAAFNVLIVGLGGEFGIHFAMRYIELSAREASGARRSSNRPNRSAARSSRAP